MKAHPIVPELLINEDGTQITWKGQSLDVKKYTYGRNNFPRKQVNFNGKTHTLTKLICETYNGEKPTMGMVVKRKDFNPENDHYTNLYWTVPGGTRTKKTKRVKTSKISVKDIDAILERIEAKEPLAAIAKDYNTSGMSIYRIKKNYLLDKKMILKREIMKAKGPYYKRLAYAKYFGFKDIQAAINKLGKADFILQTQQLALN